IGSPITFTATAAGLKQIVVVSGNNQTGVVNKALPQPLKVTVLDTRDRSVPNWPVQFSITGGGGKFDGNRNNITVNTGSDGIAQATWTLGPTVGLNNNTATASATFNNQPLPGSPIQFRASAIASDPAKLRIADGDSQSGVVGNQLAKPLKAQVTDATGNGIANHDVTFVIKAGGGTLNGSSSRNEVVKTDANGFAQVTLKLGLTSGLLNNEVEARASHNGQALAGSPVIFKATATSSRARHMTLVDGDNQTGTAGRRLPKTLRVKVTDNLNNPVPRHPVTFTVIKGGGAFDTTASITAVNLTNDNGIAAAAWYLGPVAGAPNEAHATANDGAQNLSGSPMIFKATSVAGPMDANASTIVATSPVPADGASKSEITITLTDAFGNPIPNKAVLITVSDSRDVPEQPQVPTDSKGQVKAYLKSTRAGWKSISARNINDGIKLKNDGWVKFTALAPQTMAYNNGNEQTGNIGTKLVKPLEILVTDKNGNPAPGGKVNFRITSGGGRILEPQPVVSDSNGIARANWVLGANPGTNTLQVEAALAGSPVNYSAIGVRPVPDKLVMVAGDEQEGPAGLALRDSVVVKITDANDRPVWNHPVAFVVIFDGQRTKNDTIAVVRTNFAGEAKCAWKLGTKVGLNFLEARAAGLKGSPVTFRANGTTGLAYALQISGGNDQNATVGTLSKFLVAQVVDQFKNPVAGKEVKFRILRGNGASLTRTAVVSNTAGNAGTQLQLGTSIGEYVVEATAENLFGSPIIFRINGVAAAAKEMKIQSGNNQLGTINRELPLPLEVLVVDANNNPKAGMPINFIVSKGGGRLDETKTSITVNTGANGIAQAIWKIGASTTQNGNEVTAINSDIPGSPLVFRATGVSNNNFPQFDKMPISYTIRERDVLEFPVTAKDDDGDPLSYSAVKKPTGSSFGLSAGLYRFRWTPAYDQAGLHEAVFKVEDGKGGLDQITVYITVKNLNRPPVVKPRPANLDTTVTTNTLIKYSVEATDADSDSIYYLWTDSFFGSNTVVSNTKTYNLQTSVTSNREITAYVFDLMDTVKVTWRIRITVSVELASFTAQAASFNGIRLQWQTANEVDNAGFNVLRSRSRDGEYKRINSALLPARRDGQYHFEDTDVIVGVPYYYKIEDVDIRGVKTQHGPVSAVIKPPAQFALSDNYPNPFNPLTTIRYELPSAERVALIIYNSLGQEVRRLVDEQRPVGYHVVTWDGRNNDGRLVGSGIYFYRLVAGKFIETRKMTLLR
ncbi:MAG: Ig-like domain-containing protein, partial [candidate division KSB1 bacterium]|nr:Ig-like domain-containing protein [candidate division KSB1 bacterium]